MFYLVFCTTLLFLALSELAKRTRLDIAFIKYKLTNSVGVKTTDLS